MQTPDPAAAYPRDRRLWRSGHDGSTGWHMHVKLGRLTVECHVYRHRYPTSPTRWVAQPVVIFDRG